MLNARLSRLWSVAAAAVALLFIAGSSVALSASPDPSAPSPSPSVSADPTATPSPSESPSPSAGIFCPSPTVYEAGFEVARGGTFRVRFDGFSANTPVTVVFVDWTRGDVQRPMGTSTSDGQGRGTVAGVVPRDAPIGEVILYVVAEDGCSSNSYFTVLGSAQVASIDDNTVFAGQLVTVTAGGFLPRSSVSVTFDSVITQGECSPGCRVLRSARTSAVGSAVIRTRIPRDASPGAHQLWVNGDSADGISEFSMGVDIMVVGGSTLPPTDTV